MKWVKVYCSLFWLLFSVITCHQASRLKMGELSQPGPGFFPFGIGLVMGILSLAALFLSIRGQEKKALTAQKETFRWWNIVIILGALIAYALSLEKIGFLINTFLLICLLLKVVEPQPWKTSILGGLITAVVSDLVFNVFLKAQIPSGIFGF
jgi:membrane-associated HD superfamily phosphohydrolase